MAKRDRLVSRKRDHLATFEQRLVRGKRLLEGAQLLAVMCDRLQEISEPEVARDAALLTAETYRLAGGAFLYSGSLAACVQARDAYLEAATYYDRTRRHRVRAKAARERAGYANQFVNMGQPPPSPDALVFIDGVEVAAAVGVTVGDDKYVTMSIGFDPGKGADS